MGAVEPLRVLIDILADGAEQVFGDGILIDEESLKFARNALSK